MPIKNILFDLGKVIVDIDFNRTIQAFRALGLSDFYVDLSQSDPIFHDFEIGLISEKEFVDYWLQLVPESDEQGIKDAWNALLIGIDTDIISLLHQLKSQYDLYVYSNTNAIHIDWILLHLNQKFNLTNWQPEIFRAVYYSHELGHRKPNPEGFNRILADQNISPQETIFIDDHLPNVQAALKLGFQSLHKNSTHTLRQLLNLNHLLQNKKS